MIEKSAGACDGFMSEFLDLNHTSRTMILVSLLIPKFARQPGIELRRTSESGLAEPSATDRAQAPRSTHQRTGDAMLDGARALSGETAWLSATQSLSSPARSSWRAPSQPSRLPAIVAAMARCSAGAMDACTA